LLGLHWFFLYGISAVLGLSFFILQIGVGNIGKEVVVVGYQELSIRTISVVAKLNVHINIAWSISS